MHPTPRRATTRALAAICALAVTLGLTVVPAVISSASARPSANTTCGLAQAALQHAQKKQVAAKQRIARAKKALRQAKKAEGNQKVKEAKRSLAAATKAGRATRKAVRLRQNKVSRACTSTAASTPRAVATGQKISLLGAAGGLPTGDLEVNQLVALIEQLLPGVTDHLNPSQLASLLAGFNAGSALVSADVLALLGEVLDPAGIASLLSGAADPADLTGLIDDIISQLSGLAGGLEVPAGFDPAGLWDTFAGIFGTLGAGDLGSLLALLTSAFGSPGASLDLGQLTGLIDSLIPGISEQFDLGQLTAMLSGVNGGGLDTETLAHLLGGQFSPGQLESVLNGTSGPALLGAVIAQVIAQLGTAGEGGLELPGPLSGGALSGLISSVTGLVSSLFGGGELAPVVCGLIPIPFLCP